jgi:uncharacterized OsmC-like protein
MGDLSRSSADPLHDLPARGPAPCGHEPRRRARPAPDPHTTVVIRPEVCNGVDTHALEALVQAVTARPDLARGTFSATNRWVDGAHSRTTMSPSNGSVAGTPRAAVQSCPADRPSDLCGYDSGPMPIESLLHAVAACLTASTVEVAASSGVELVQIETSIEADVDLVAAFGVAAEDRPGCREIRLDVRIVGDEPPPTYAAVLEEASRRSPVLATLTTGLPVVIKLHTEGTA